MDLTTLASEPALNLISIDDEDTVKEFGEPLTFYTWDRQPLDVFLRLSAAIGNKQEESIEILKTLILTKDGEPVLTGKKNLPTKVMIRAMAKVMDLLGN